MGTFPLIAALAAICIRQVYGQQNTPSVSNANTYAGVTTSVGSDGFTTVPYPPSCNAAMYNTLYTYAVYDTYAGEEYMFQCGPASAGSTIASQPGTTWRDCFAWCDQNPACTSFSFNNGGAYGEALPNGGTGATCNLKNTNPAQFTSYAALVSSRVVGLRRSYG